MKKKYEIEKNLVISIDHFKDSSIKLLQDNNFPSIIVVEFDFGYKIERFTDDPLEKNTPKDIKMVVKLADKLGLDWIIIDIDGPIYSWLKVYEYGE